MDVLQTVLESNGLKVFLVVMVVACVGYYVEKCREKTSGLTNEDARYDDEHGTPNDVGAFSTPSTPAGVPSEPPAEPYTFETAVRLYERASRKYENARARLNQKEGELPIGPRASPSFRSVEEVIGALFELQVMHAEVVRRLNNEGTIVSNDQNYQLSLLAQKLGIRRETL